MRILELERNNKDISPTLGADDDNSFEMQDSGSRAVIAELRDEKNNMQQALFNEEQKVEQH